MATGRMVGRAGAMPARSPFNRSRSPLTRDFYQFIEKAWRRYLSFNYDSLPEVQAIQGGFNQKHADPL
jgi:hypothetical protein